MNEIKPRKPWVALAMSLVLPGFGQLYNGEPNEAIWLFLVFAFLCIPGIAIVALYLPSGLMLPALLLSLIATLGLWVYGMVDAWRGATSRPDYQPAAWQLSGVYLLVLILCDIVALPMLTGYVRTHVVESFRIPSTSMAPSVMQGDILFADKRYNCPGCKADIRRGDIAIFVYPNNRTRLYIKRIIALPGDRVQIHGAVVSVNGQPLSQENDATLETLEGRRWHIRPAPAAQSNADVDLTVPPGKVFVLGDNRAASTDSRIFGVVPMQDVVGRARQVWLSLGDDGVRWARLGTVLQ